MKEKREPMVRLCFRCEKKMADWIRRKAKLEGKSISAFVRELLEVAIAEYQKQAMAQAEGIAPAPGENESKAIKGPKLLP